MFGHIHQGPSSYSSILNTIECGTPLKVLKVNEGVNEDFDLVESKGQKGHVWHSYLEPTRPVCFTSQFPQFFNSLNLDVGDIYYWARLYDQFIFIKTKVVK